MCSQMSGLKSQSLPAISCANVYTNVHGKQGDRSFIDSQVVINLLKVTMAKVKQASSSVQGGSRSCWGQGYVGVKVILNMGHCMPSAVSKIRKNIFISDVQVTIELLSSFQVLTFALFQIHFLTQWISKPP